MIIINDNCNELLQECRLYATNFYYILISANVFTNPLKLSRYIFAFTTLYFVAY